MSEIQWKNKYISSQAEFGHVFTSEECDRIVATFFKSEGRMGAVDEGTVDLSVRSVKYRELLFSPDLQWIADRILQKVIEVNNNLYRFQLARIDEFKVLEYNSGDFYDWHIDLGKYETACTRKISIIVFINDRHEYEGGQLIWHMTDFKDKVIITQQKGSIVLFPSFMPHKVEKVTSGTRKVLLAWVHGNSFV
jgi:PKHD-type hydroxylase